jgi:hypothetical protein
MLYNSNALLFLKFGTNAGLRGFFVLFLPLKLSEEWESKDIRHKHIAPRNVGATQ